MMRVWRLYKITKTEIFKNELAWIENENVKAFAETAIEMLPDYFFTVSASSTGKYHSKYASGSGGLVRHVKSCAKFAHEILELEQNSTFTQKEKDLIITSVILHDGLKHGVEGSAFTVAEHPILCADWIRNNDKLNSMLDSIDLEILCSAIASHMGQWTTDYKSKKEILPKPQTEIQKFVHMCDYLGSRKWIEVDFEDDYYDGKYESEREVDNTIKSIIQLCKEKITSGVNRDTIYSLIETETGSKNPNKITDNDIALTLLDKIGELHI